MTYRDILITKPREVIDRRALTKQLDDLLGWEGYGPQTRGKVLEIFKEANRHAWHEVKRRFETGDIPAMQVITQNAYFMDQLIRLIHDVADIHVYPNPNPTAGEAMTIVATGGYGRGELAPYSDIDLMFLLPYKITPRTEQIVEFVLYTLWDLGLKVGHATRSVDEAVSLARDDLTIRTAMLEARWLWGDQGLFDRFRDAYWKSVTGTERQFVEQKLGERDERHEKMGDTRYVLEPNIKEGKGGLRDLQTLIWIAKYIYRVGDMSELAEKGAMSRADVKLFRKAETFLWTTRCHLHYLAGRPEERMTFNVQADLAERMGYRDHTGTKGVERVMKHYFLIAKGVGDLTRILCAVLEEEQKKSRRFFKWPSLGLREPSVPGFGIDSGRLTFDAKTDLKKKPIKVLELFHASQAKDLDIHPNALRAVTQNLKLVDKALRADKRANSMFVDMLTGTNPVRTLMGLNEAGVFGRFIPDFGRVVAQMQYDMYHVYTVDEHTIRAIGILNGIETRRLVEDHPVACSVVSEVQSRRALYVAVLLHDIAKGRGGDHSVLGAEVADKLCPRLGLNDWETETVSWLVRYHLLMSATAFKRDLEDPKTIDDFCDIVQSPERLRLLLVLTVADIRAVGPNVWNAWKAGLLRELYWHAQARLSGEIPSQRHDARIERAQNALASVLRARPHEWPEGEIETHLELGRPAYWLTIDHPTHVRHATLIRAANETGEDLRIETQAVPERGATEVTVFTADHPGLFASIAGALALSGLTILDAKVATLADGHAVDSFWVQGTDGKLIDEPERLARIATRITEVLTGKKRVGRELAKARKEAVASRTRVFKVPPRVLIDNHASDQYTVIEINGRNRVGFLHDVTSALTEEGLQISSAQISTYGERVVDVFYVKDVFGLKVMHADKLKAIEARLLKKLKAPSSPKKKGDAKTGRAAKAKKSTVAEAAE